MYPGSGLEHGSAALVTVSPTLVSATFFMLAEIYPTSPAVRESVFRILGVKIPTSVTSKVFPLENILILSPTLTLPSNILTREIAPL